MTNKQLREVMESRIVEIELPTKDILIYHAASILTASKDKTWAIIRKRFRPIAIAIDTSKVTDENENTLLKVPMSEADILFIHDVNVFADHRYMFAKWVSKWISPVALKILSERKEYQ
jgi:hypothetical protein